LERVFALFLKHFLYCLLSAGAQNVPSLSNKGTHLIEIKAESMLQGTKKRPEGRFFDYSSGCFQRPHSD
jgi:hypothetical protein